MHQLDIGGTISRSFNLYEKHWQRLIIISAIVAIPTSIISVALREIAPTSLESLLSSGISFLGSGLLAGMYALTVKDLEDGTVDQSVSEIVNGALAKFGPLVIVSLLYGLGVTFGLLLLVVPGIIAAVMWMLATTTVMLEDTNGSAALSRSREIIRGNGWAVFGLVILMGILAFVAALVLGLVFYAIAGANAGSSFVVSTVAQTVVGPIFGMIPVLVYLQLTADGAGTASAPEAASEVPPAGTAYPTPPAPTTPPPSTGGVDYGSSTITPPEG